MPKSWIDWNSDTAEPRDAIAVAGVQHQAPRFAVPQDDEDIFHAGGVGGEAGPMPGTYSRITAEAADRDADLTASLICAGCGTCRFSDGMDTTLLGESVPPPCIMPCRMSEESSISYPPCAYSRQGAETGTAADMEMTALADAIPYPCLPPRMPESLQASSAAQLPPPSYYCRQSR